MCLLIGSVKYCLVFLPCHDLLEFRVFENIFLVIMIKTVSSPTNIRPKYYIIVTNSKNYF